MDCQLPLFSEKAKEALRAIDSHEDRTEIILLLLQISSCNDHIPICGADVRAAQLMVELRVHL